MADYIGSKISLISKAGIRYEGILYTIDPVEFTVALSKVKSFGTEDRKSERFIEPREEIYEYIIFRGSDIADLNVCETTKEGTLESEDSAIVVASEATVNMSSHGMQNSGEATMKQKSSKTPTKSESIEKSSMSKTGTKPPLSASNNNSKNTKRNGKTSNETDKNEKSKSKHDRNAKTYEKYHDYYDYGYDENYENIGYHQSSNGYYYSMSRPANTQKSSSNYSNGRRATYDSHYNSYMNHYYSDSTTPLRGFASSEYNGSSGAHHYYDYRPSRQVSNNNYENGKSQGNKHRKKASANKTEATGTKKDSYKEDYDFESANAIIAQELQKMTLKQEKKEVKELTEDIKKEEGELPECSDTRFYDKGKSFFDNISSEVIDRAKGKMVRTMNRKEERQMNVETFGVAESRNTNKKNRIRSNGGGGNHGGYRWSRGGGGANHRRSNNRRSNANHQSYLSALTNNNKRAGGHKNIQRPVPAVGGPDC